MAFNGATTVVLPIGEKWNIFGHLNFDVCIIFARLVFVFWTKIENSNHVNDILMYATGSLSVIGVRVMNNNTIIWQLCCRWRSHSECCPLKRVAGLYVIHTDPGGVLIAKVHRIEKTIFRLIVRQYNRSWITRSNDPRCYAICSFFPALCFDSTVLHRKTKLYTLFYLGSAKMYTWYFILVGSNIIYIENQKRSSNATTRSKMEKKNFFSAVLRLEQYFW